MKANIIFIFVSIYISGNSIASGIPFVIPANPIWTSTGLSLDYGVKDDVDISVKASGSWSASWYGYPYTGPDGLGGSGGYDEWVQSASKGSLIGYIGDNPYLATTGRFAIGSSGTFKSSNGTLWLGFNDAKVSHLGATDNVGSVNAMVNIPCDAIIKDSVIVSRIGTKSKSGDPTSINASFKPNFNLTLAQAADSCGFDNFNWQQTVELLPFPSPFFAVNNPSIPLSAPPAFFDPVEGGYTYDPIITNNRYPFYYNNSNYPKPLRTDSMLIFGDTPSNSFLTGYDYMKFTTRLVGVSQGKVIDPDLYEFMWISNYNGNSGGIARISNDLLADPDSGTGGVRILSINGIPVNNYSAPEPSTIYLFSLGLAGLLFGKRRKQASSH